jgi:hypothetical protein
MVPHHFIIRSILLLSLLSIIMEHTIEELVNGAHAHDTDFVRHDQISRFSRLTIAGFVVDDFFHMTEQEVVNEARIDTYMLRKRYAVALYEMTSRHVQWDPRLNSNAAAPHVNGLAHTGGAVIATPTVAVGFASDAVAPQVQRITDP